MMNIHDCMFCYPSPNLVLGESPNFRIICDPYPLVEGHIMIISKTHFGCVGELPKKQMDEFYEIKQEYARRLLKLFGRVSSYEHGRAGTCHILTTDGPPACDHMHLHLVPVNVCVKRHLGQFSPIAQTTIKETAENFYRFGNYFYFENSDGSTFYPAENLDIPSHFLRTLIANEIGRPDRADWENYTNAEVLDIAL